MMLLPRYYKIMIKLNEIADANHLFQSFMRAKQNTDWKESVQKYEISLLQNIRETQKSLMDDTYKAKSMVEFELNERGRKRLIKSQHIKDRVIQRSLNDYVLIPRIRKYLIYDNGASLTGKGVDFSRKRFEVHLQRAFKEYKGEGYILHIDFSKYFDNILHGVALEQYRRFLSEDELYFMRKCFREFEVDVSYMSDSEFDSCLSTLFNAVEYSKLPKETRTGEKMMQKSVGIGNQISQITGILYPHRVDNYCKIVKSLKYYGRYMDDTYIIHHDKKFLQELLKELVVLCKSLGIFVNEKKTSIQKLTGWNTFLKINYKITATGKLVRKVHNSTIRRERQRLRKFKKLLDKRRMKYEDILQCFMAWKGVYRKYDSGYKIKRLDAYFSKLFAGKECLNGRKTTNYSRNLQFKKRTDFCSFRCR